MLEQKVQELLKEQNNIQDLKDSSVLAFETLAKALEEIPDYCDLKEGFDKSCEVRSQKLKEALAIESLLKAEILTKMTETTHKFDCATITKKVKQTLTIGNPEAFLEHLQKTAQTTADKVKTTLNFNPCNLISAISNGHVVLPEDKTIACLEGGKNTLSITKKK